MQVGVLVKRWHARPPLHTPLESAAHVQQALDTPVPTSLDGSSSDTLRAVLLLGWLAYIGGAALPRLPKELWASFQRRVGKLEYTGSAPLTWAAMEADGWRTAVRKTLGSVGSAAFDRC